MPLMADTTVQVNPTLLLGLGGRGCLTVNETIRLLLDRCGDDLPPFVRVLGIDSTWDAREHELLGPRGWLERLQTGDLARLINDISDGGQPDLASWYDPRMAVPQLGGAGLAGNRHLGALAFARNCGGVYQRLQGLLHALLAKDLQAKTTAWQQECSHKTRFQINEGFPQAVIVASTCGGTGAGLALDIAALLRAYDEQLTAELSILLLLYLPDSWDVVATCFREQWQVNTHAMLMEVDALQSGQYKYRRMLGMWGPSSEPVVKLRTSPFSSVFLIDGRGGDAGTKFGENQIVDSVARLLAALCMQPLGSLVRNHLVNVSGKDVPGNPHGALNYHAVGMSRREMSDERAGRLVVNEYHRLAKEFVQGRPEPGLGPDEVLGLLNWRSLDDGPRSITPTMAGRIGEKRNAARRDVRRQWDDAKRDGDTQKQQALGEAFDTGLVESSLERARRAIATAVSAAGVAGGLAAIEVILKEVKVRQTGWADRARAAGRDAGLARTAADNAFQRTQGADPSAIEQARESARVALGNQLTLELQESWFSQAEAVAEQVSAWLATCEARFRRILEWLKALWGEHGPPAEDDQLLPLAWTEFKAGCREAGYVGQYLATLSEGLWTAGGIVAAGTFEEVDQALRRAAEAVEARIPWKVRNRLSQGTGTNPPELALMYQDAEIMLQMDPTRYQPELMATGVLMEGVEDREREAVRPQFTCTPRNTRETLQEGEVLVCKAVGLFPLRSIAQLTDWRDGYRAYVQSRKRQLQTDQLAGINPHNGAFWWLPDLLKPDETKYPDEAVEMMVYALALGALARGRKGVKRTWVWALESANPTAYTLRDLLPEGGPAVSAYREDLFDDLTTRDFPTMARLMPYFAGAIPPRWPAMIVERAEVLYGALQDDGKSDALRSRLEAAGPQEGGELWQERWPDSSAGGLALLPRDQGFLDALIGQIKGALDNLS